MTGRRIVSIFLPHLAMERWLALAKRSAAAPDSEPPTEDEPMVLAKDGPHGPVIHASNRAARSQGLLPGERVVDMRALCPELQVHDADVAGDQAALDQLVLWVRRWCPWSVKDGDDGLILDTTGSDHLMGGEGPMLADMEKRFADLGLTIHCAIAPNWGSAWALARYGTVPRAICTADTLTDQLASLPVPALRLDSATVLLLRRLGLKTIGTLAKLPRLSLARRFANAELSANPVLRLDQAVGRQDEPVSSVTEKPILRVKTSLPEPIHDPTHYLPNLCADLCEQLTRNGAGCRGLRLDIYRTDGVVSTLNVATSRPSRDPRHLERLFDGYLEKINPGFGFDMIMLTAGAVETLDNGQTNFDTTSDNDADLSRLIDRLAARLGNHAVLVPAMRQHHVPERAEHWVSALSAPPLTMAEKANAASKERPIRLLNRPEPIRVIYAVPEGPPAQFVWRRLAHRIARYSGPERIAPEWWRDRPGTRLRDYYRIEDETGRRFWIYREGLHNDGRGGEPSWFMHGMFS